MPASHDSHPSQCLLASLFDLAIWSEPIESVLRHIAHVSLSVFADAASASVWEVMGDALRPVVATDEHATTIDVGQLERRAGPCLEAFCQGTPSTVDDTQAWHAWSTFCSTAAAHGVRSVLSLPMQVGTEHAGVINLYAELPAAFSEPDLWRGMHLARHAATLALTSRACSVARSESQHLRRAMQSRAPIEQAKGIIMAANRCSADEAFAILVRASQNQNRKLRDIAAEIVHRTSHERAVPTTARPRPRSPGLVR